MHIRNVLVKQPKGTYLPLSSSSKSKSKTCGTRRIVLVLILIWMAFSTWFFFLYGRGYFSEKHEDSDDHVTPPIITKPVVNDFPQEQQQPVIIEQPAPPVLPPSDGSVIPILVIAYKRAAELKRCLDTLLKYAPETGFQLFVSEDGTDESVANVARSYGNKVVLFQHPRNVIIPPNPIGKNADYYALSQHYQWAINQVFSQDPKYSRIIILEEDLEVSPDFFSYFRRLSPYLDEDPSVLCISAWNDNGMNQFVSDPQQIYRSDFFPGLGWMVSRTVWENELRDTWPLGYWDDWLREPQNRKGRNCLRPEINRTYTFGEKGTSKGQFFKNYLEKIRLNDANIDWDKVDLSYLEKSNYDKWLEDLVASAEAVNVHQLSNYRNQGKDLKVLYNNKQYEVFARQIGIMPELKAGVPRGAYHGVVIVRYEGNRLLLVPHVNKAQPITYSNEGPYGPR